MNMGLIVRGPGAASISYVCSHADPSRLQAEVEVREA